MLRSCLHICAWMIRLLQCLGEETTCTIPPVGGNQPATPVVRNETLLRLINTEQGDSGWEVALEVSFSRDPPLYGDEDESIVLDCNVIQYRGEGGPAQPKPAPLTAGRRLVADLYVHGLHSARQELEPLMEANDESSELITFYQFMVGTQAFSKNRVRCHGTLVVRVELDLFPHGRLSAEVRCVLEKTPPDLLDTQWPVAPRLGLLGHCLSEVHYDGSCWRHIRQRLFSVPAFTTQAELVVASMSSSSFFGEANTPAFRSLFPVDDAGHTNRFDKCAVVGSAGHLLNSSLGAHIDAHELILRFNEAPTLGFEADVGSHTTHRIVPGLRHDHIHSYIGHRIRPRPDSEQLIFFPKHLPGTSGIDEFLFWNARANGTGVHLLSPVLVQHAWHMIASRSLDKIPSSGFVGILWAMSVCNHVDLYGMGYYHPPPSPPDPTCAASLKQQGRAAAAEAAQRAGGGGWEGGGGEVDACEAARAVLEARRSAYSYYARPPRCSLMLRAHVMSVPCPAAPTATTKLDAACSRDERVMPLRVAARVVSLLAAAIRRGQCACALVALCFCVSVAPGPALMRLPRLLLVVVAAALRAQQDGLSLL